MFFTKNKTFYCPFKWSGVLFSAIILISCFTSCSTYQVADNYTTNKLKKRASVHRSTIIDSVQVDYWDSESEKPVLILIHGFGATAEFQWYQQIKSLSQNYRLIIPSLLYFGDTHPLGKDRYTIQDQVNLITGLMNSLKVSKAHICGVSYGGLVAAEITRQFPERINRLIIFDAVLKYYDKNDIQAMCYAYRVNNFKDIFTPSNAKEVRRLFDVVFYKPPPVPAFLFKSVYEEVYKENQVHHDLLLDSLYSNMSYFQNQEYTFDNKTLIIWGEYDDAVPLKTGHALNEHIPNSTLKIIPKTKHMPNLEKPKYFNELVTSFLKTSEE